MLNFCDFIQVFVFTRNHHLKKLCIGSMDATSMSCDLNREGLNSISDINLKVLNGISDNISKQGQNELVGALLQYIKCTNRFRQV